MAKNTGTTTSVADLDKLLDVDHDAVNNTATKTLMPTSTCYVVLTGLEVSDPDKDTGERHAKLSLSQLDLTATLAAGKPVAQGGSFEMREYGIKVPGAKTRVKGKLVDTTQEDIDKARERRSAMFGLFCRSAGVELPKGAGAGWVVDQIKNAGMTPVGVLNPTTNGPDLPDSYKNNQTGKMETTTRKDYGEVTFAVTTPASVMAELHRASERVLASGRDVTEASLADSLRLVDHRQYAKTAAAAAKNRRVPTGGGQRPGGGGGFEDMGPPPEEG